MMLWLIENIIIILLLLQMNKSEGNRRYLHSQQYNNELMKQGEGWMEPGLWRPNFIIDTSIDRPECGILSQRFRVRLMQDKTVMVFDHQSRPRVSFLWFGRDVRSLPRNLIETIMKKKDQPVSRFRSPSSGAWSFKDIVTAGYGEVKFDVVGANQERIRYETISGRGKLDGYSAKMRDGVMYQYQFTKRGIPTSYVRIGSFSVKVSPHRPLLAPDFVAFH